MRPLLCLTLITLAACAANSTPTVTPSPSATPTPIVHTASPMPTLDLPSEDVPLELLMPTLANTSMNLSPDGRLLVIRPTAGTRVQFRDMEGGAELPSFELDDADSALYFSRDMRYLVEIQRSGARRVTLYDADTRAPVLSLHLDEQFIQDQFQDTPYVQPGFYTYTTFVAPSPDGDLLAITGAHRTSNTYNSGLFLLYDVDSQTASVHEAGDQHAYWGAFTSDGARFLFATTHGDSCSRLGPVYLQVWDVASKTRLLVRRVSSLNSYALHPDKRTVALAIWSSACPKGPPYLALWDMQTDDLRILSDLSYAAVAFSPDGHYLASLGKEGTVRLWDVQTGVAQREWRLIADEDDFWDSAYGLQLAYTPSGIRVVGQRDGLYTALIPTPP